MISLDHMRKFLRHADRQVLLAGIGILALVAVIVWSYTQSIGWGRPSNIDTAVSRQGNISDDIEAIERDFIAFPLEDSDAEVTALDAELAR